MSALGVTIFDRCDDENVFASWSDEVRSAAQSMTGFVGFAASSGGETLDRAIAVTFDGENALHAWLDTARWKELARRGAERGVLRVTSDLVIVDGAVLPGGVGVVSSRVAPGKETEFLAAHTALTDAASGFSGYEGTAVFPPGASGEWRSLIRFRTESQLSAWLLSPQRAAVLPPVRSSLVQDFSVFAQTTPWGTTVRRVNGETAMTPGWKTAMLLLMVLYPMVMLQTRFVAPVIGGLGADPWLAVWIGQVLSVMVMQWWVMPTVSSWCRRWLDPVDGAGWRVSLRGAAIAVAVYALSWTVFASVDWLQYWD